MTNKPKIIISVNDFLVGGAQKLIVDQLEYFTNRGYSIELITLMDFPNRANLYDSINPKVKIHKIKLKSSFDIFGWIRLFKVLQKTKPNVVFSHLFLSNMMTRVISFFISLRVFTVEQNTYKNKDIKSIFIDRLLSSRSEKIISVSNEVKDFTIIQQKIKPDKCIVIPNGVNVSVIEEFKKTISKEESRIKKNIDINTKVFISVARLTPQKNLPLLIESFIDFHSRNLNTMLIMLGGGGEYEKLKTKIGRENAEGYIKMMGNVSDVYTYCRSADFLISTSYIEGLSIAFLEALSFGLPIISTKTGGTGVLIKDGVNGFIISDFKKDSVIEAIDRAMLANYDNLSKEALVVSKDFSVDETSKKYEALI
ncbi:MAG: glycosyltransferase family 4 protein [Candidatus Pacebacteria bacterium]|nr:glycosyltransferase family 4 protein [Candidatus Paceibacterota bacterium]